MGVKLIVGPQTAELVRDVYQVVELDLIAVKGKTEPAKIFTVLETFDHPGEKQHDKFLQLYREGQWEAAQKFASDLKQCWQGNLSDYYDSMISRIEEFRMSPPKDWDGVYRATSK